jgi:hypothetical protein
MWWHMSIIPALGRQTQIHLYESQIEFKANLGHIAKKERQTDRDREKIQLFKSTTELARSSFLVLF